MKISLRSHPMPVAPVGSWSRCGVALTQSEDGKRMQRKPKTNHVGKE